MNRILMIVLVLLLTGCAAKRIAQAPQKLYHFAYCDKMNADGKHCDRWATPCGQLVCKEN